jgi:hypothetical protein
MLAVAAYCAGRMVVARQRHRTTSYPVDTFHVAMGVAMAGMLSPRLGLRTAGMWTALFAVAGIWFAARAARSAGRWTHLAHVGSSGAMVVMLTATPAGAATTGSMPPATGPAPVLAVLLIGFLAVYTGALIERLPAGVGHPGELAPRSVACCQIAMNAAMAYMLFMLVS